MMSLTHVLTRECVTLHTYMSKDDLAIKKMLKDTYTLTQHCLKDRVIFFLTFAYTADQIFKMYKPQRRKYVCAYVCTFLAFKNSQTIILHVIASMQDLVT